MEHQEMNQEQFYPRGAIAFFLLLLLLGLIIWFAIYMKLI